MFRNIIVLAQGTYNMEIIAVVVAVLALISFFVFDLPSKIKEWVFAVYVTPKLITVDKSDWVTKTSLQVINNKSFPIYSVELHVVETVVGTHIEDMEIKPEPYMISGTDMNAFVISKEDKKTKLRSKVVPLHHLKPQSSLNINIIIPATQKLEKFKVKIVGYKKEPVVVREQNKVTLVKFNLK
jgi:hypothetical protein